MAAVSAIVLGPANPVTLIATAVATVAGIGAQLTAPKPVARGSATNVIIDTEPPRPYMIGESYSAGVLRHRVGYGPTLKKVPNPFLWEVKVFSGVGPVEQLVQEQFDFAPIGSYYRGFYSSVSQLGLRPQPAALVPPLNAPATGWGSASKLSGFAAIGGNYKFDKDGKVFASGTPLHGAIWKGEKVYDPRLDSTYPGGVGAHRLGDETTYTYSTNPALHAGTYAFGRYQNGIKVFGLGLAEDGIDWPAIVDWANLCEANEWECHGTIYEGGRGANVQEQRLRNLDDICAAGGGRWLVAGALLSFDWQRPRVPLATLTDDDLLEEGGSATAVQPLRDRMNGVRPQYVSPLHNWEQITADEIVGTTYRTEDGQPLTQTWTLNLVKSPEQAGELASYALVDSREIGPIELSTKAQWRFYKPGETITVNSTLLGYNGQAVIVSRDLDPQTLAVRLTLKSETPAKHDFALGKVANPPPTPVITQTQEERDLAVYGAITPRAVDVEYNDAATVESLKPAEPGATEGALIPLPGSDVIGSVKDNTGRRYDPGELLNASLELTSDGRLQYRPLPDVAPQQIGQIEVPDLGAASAAAMRQAEDDIDQAGRALAVALNEASRTRDTFTDAGFFVDPATGQIKIHAVEQTAERISTAEIRLNAAEANINLRATVNYVDEAILNAVIDPGQIAELDTVFVRLTAAEVDIDGLQATVTTLATATELSLVSGRVTTAESAIDALEGTITTKVDTTEFDALESRVTSAETTLTAIGDVAEITSQVTATRVLERAQDANAESDLRALLTGDRNQRDQVAAIASAQQQLTAQIVDGLSADAAQRLTLQARVGTAEASLVSESIARASGDSALSGQISSLTTTVNGNTATLTTFGESINGLQARQGVRLDVNGRITGYVQNNNGAQGNFIVVADNFKVVDPDTGNAFIDADEDGLRIVNGRFIADNGTVMDVRGRPFGTSNQFIAWSGPSRALNLCDEASAISYLKTNGEGYYGGALAAGTISNSGRSTLASATQFTLGTFVSNGDPITVVVNDIAAQVLANDSTTWRPGIDTAPADPFAASRVTYRATYTLESSGDGGATWTTRATYTQDTTSVSRIVNAGTTPPPESSPLRRWQHVIEPALSRTTTVTIGAGSDRMLRFTRSSIINLATGASVASLITTTSIGIAATEE